MILIDAFSLQSLAHSTFKPSNWKCVKFRCKFVEIYRCLTTITIEANIRVALLEPIYLPSEKQRLKIHLQSSIFAIIEFSTYVRYSISILF